MKAKLCILIVYNICYFSDKIFFLFITILSKMEIWALIRPETSFFYLLDKKKIIKILYTINEA